MKNLPFHPALNAALQPSFLSVLKSSGYLILLILSFCFTHAIQAQTTPAIEWQKSLGGSSDDYAESIQQTTDGGFIVAGYSSSNNGDVSENHGIYDYWIVKVDADGNLAWQKCLGGSDWDAAYSIQQTTDGGFIVGGYSESNDGDVSGNHGNSDYWIVKLDADGNLAWQKSLGGSGDDFAYSMQQTTDGGFTVAGWSKSNDGDVSGWHEGYTSYGYPTSDYWFVKLDADGNIEWQKCLGGSGYDEAHSVQQTTDGGFIVGGWSYSNDGDVSGHHGASNYPDYWIVKLDANGNLIWQKSLGGSGYDKARSVQQTTDDGFIVAGFSTSNNGDVSGNHGVDDYWIVKLSPEGQSCPAPTDLSVTNITTSSAKVNWNMVAEAIGYKVRYKITGTPEWTNIQSKDNDKTLSGLSANTEYAWQVKTICGVYPIVSSDWSEKQFFTTDLLRLATINETMFEVYPNPVSQSATVSFS